jgi:immunity protein 10 of polymorphic toxin system
MVDEAMTSASTDELTIRRVAVQELPDLNTMLVGLYEWPDGTGRSLALQVAVPFDEQDEALGQDTYCVTNEWGASAYGGIHEVQLDGDVLMIRFAPVAAVALSIDPVLRMRLAIDASSLAELKKGLRTVLLSGRREHPTVVV